MNRRSPPVSEVLDESAEVVATIAAPWVGLAWLTALPLRLLQAFFFEELITLGAEASQYGDHLTDIATAVFVALIPALWGRAVFVRACSLALRTRAAPDRAALRIPAAGGLSFLYVALLFEALFFATAMTLVALPALALLSGLAAATHLYVERPSLIGPLRQIAEQLKHALSLIGLGLATCVAWLIAFVNLYFVFQIGLWLLAAVPGFDTGPWAVRLSQANPRFLLVVAAGAALTVEPFWLAALTVFVHKARSRETGEDLRVWFAALRRRP